MCSREIDPPTKAPGCVPARKLANMRKNLRKVKWRRTMPEEVREALATVMTWLNERS
jgi:hypothetical protein